MNGMDAVQRAIGAGCFEVMPRGYQIKYSELDALWDMSGHSEWNLICNAYAYGFVRGQRSIRRKKRKTAATTAKRKAPASA